MDVFKLLSRSKPGARNPAPATHTLPSSGAAANPQLFGRDEAHSTNRKRKRGQDKTQAADEDLSVDPGLDFFRTPATTKTKTKTKTKTDGGQATRSAGGEHAVSETAAADAEAVPEESDLDARKQVLRAHKLKVAVLADWAAEAPSTSSKSKKDKKKRKTDDASKTKKEKKAPHKQIYPVPLAAFQHLARYNISRCLARNLHEQGYLTPTEVQMAALPLLLGGQRGVKAGEIEHGDVDLLTVAPTGSGKTVAFLVPVLDGLLREAAVDASDASTDAGPRAIVIAPTRELAAQIVNEARKLAKGTGIKATLMRKGMEVVERDLASDRPADDASGDDLDTASESDADDADDASSSGHVQQKPARRRAERVKAAIIVATPLALLNALKRRDGSTAPLPTVRRIVLDEADVLLDPLFRDQTLAVWNACTNPLLRVGLWSATMGASVESLALSTLTSRWESLKKNSADLPPRPPLLRLVVGLKDTAIPNVAHQLTYAATEAGKLLGLRQLLHPTSSTGPTLRPPFLVFTQTIPRAIALHAELLYDIPPEAGGSSRIAVLHADLSSSARDNIMTRFRRGDIWVLITTDLLARGVDFRGLNGVVNFDAPTSAAAYVHRVGRTGRAGRTGGVAVTLYTDADVPYVRLIANVIRASEKLNGIDPEQGQVRQWLLDALPAPSKRDKARLKRRGVESRRSQVTGQEGRKARISTKSGFERRLENRRRGAVEGSRRRERVAREGDASEGDEE